MAQAGAAASRLDPEAGIAAPFSGEDLAVGLASPDERDVVLLRQRWRRAIGRAAPPGMGARLMLRILLWREQIGRVGDVDRATRAKLAAALGETPEPGRERTTPAASARLRIWTVLTREHQGALQRVTVTADGFVWRETTYRSLSAVARAITGTSWNGRRFFGVADERKTDARGMQDGGSADSTQALLSPARSERPAPHGAAKAPADSLQDPASSSRPGEPLNPQVAATAQALRSIRAKARLDAVPSTGGPAKAARPAGAETSPAAEPPSDYGTGAP